MYNYVYRKQTAGLRSANLFTHMHVDKISSRSKVISIANISQMMTNMANKIFATNIKLYTAFQLAYLHLTLAHINSQGQGHAHFDCQYIENGDR